MNLIDENVLFLGNFLKVWFLQHNFYKMPNFEIQNQGCESRSAAGAIPPYRVGPGRARDPGLTGQN